MSEEAKILNQMAARLDASGDYRVLRRVPEVSAYHRDDGETKGLALVLDTETTGLNVHEDRPIELGLIPFEYGRETGRIFRVFRHRNWLESPGHPLSPEIVRLTGLTDRDLAGNRINDAEVRKILERCSLVIAHNAAFDRTILERRLPDFSKISWACFQSGIAWSAEDIGSQKLGYILMRFGYFFDEHRTEADCRALLHVLSCAMPASGSLTLLHLLDSARKTVYRVWADDNQYGTNDLLKAKGYRWSDGLHGRHKRWHLDVQPDRVADELRFLLPVMKPLKKPKMVPLTALERFSERAYRIP